jgi:thiamine-phosphate pyrophosphorylase
VIPPGAPLPSAIYAIADADALAPRSLAAGALAMADAGIRTIQLRAKSLDDAALFREAGEVVRGLEGWNGELWIDDRVDLACVLDFSGVHLGQRDLPAAAARRILPPERRIGASTHDERQFAAALAEPAADWVAFGPVFATRSKANADPVVGLEALGRIARMNRVGRPTGAKPLIAIGGIDERTVGQVLAAGADSAAVISAVCSGDIAANCRRLLAAAAA